MKPLLNGLVRRLRGGCLVMLAVVFGMTGSVLAQALRDPTVAPAAAGFSNSGVPQHEEIVKTGSISVLQREGVRYLMIGTRLYGVGQRVGQARIERISETEIWLREGGQLKKIQVFSGVQRRAAEPPLAPKQPADAPTVVRPVHMTP